MSKERQYVLTAHAAAVMAERGIDGAWVRRVLMEPGRLEVDRHDSRLRHALGRVAERDDRMLRVIYDPEREPWRVVTAYFDRRERVRR